MISVDVILPTSLSGIGSDGHCFAWLGFFLGGGLCRSSGNYIIFQNPDTLSERDAINNYTGNNRLKQDRTR